MKTLLLVPGGRGGSKFFHAVLDGHSQILQFPGHLKIDRDFQEMVSLDSAEKISKKFIDLYPEFFNSKLSVFEGYNCLGKKKNKFFKVNKKKFINFFYQLMNKKKKVSKIEILKNLHISYSLSKGEKKNRKKIIFIHTNSVNWTKEFIKKIKSEDVTIIHIIRHPLSAISAPIKAWLNFKGGSSFFPKDLYFHLNLALNGIYELMKLKKVYIIQLEKLHRRNELVMKDFCRIFKLKYEKCLKSSTKFGLQWWGDRASQKQLTGFNKNFKINIDKSYFFKRDLIFFQFLAEKIIKKYKYDFIFSYKKIYFNLLPMRCELTVWKNSFKHFRWKHILSIPVFYLMRIFLINEFTKKNKKMPYSIG